MMQITIYDATDKRYVSTEKEREVINASKEILETVLMPTILHCTEIFTNISKKSTKK